MGGRGTGWGGLQIGHETLLARRGELATGDDCQWGGYLAAARGGLWGGV